MKTTKPATATQFIYFNGFTLSTGSPTIDVIFGVEGSSRRLFEPKLFEGNYTFEQFVEFIQSVLDLPEVRKNISKVTVVTDTEAQYRKHLKKAINRPVKLICDFNIAEAAVKETRDGIRNTWSEYNSSMLFSLAS